MTAETVAPKKLTLAEVEHEIDVALQAAVWKRVPRSQAGEMVFEGRTLGWLFGISRVRTGRAIKYSGTAVWVLNRAIFSLTEQQNKAAFLAAAQMKVES